MDPGAAAPRPVNAVPPYGHVICCEKWRNSALVQSLRGGGVKILFENELGVADFHLPNRTKVLYVSESDMVAANSYKRKLVRFRNASSSFQQLVLVEQTVLSQQYFAAVQRFVSLDLGLALLPVGGQAEASQLVTQMILTEGRDNPFGRRPPCQILEPAVLAAVRQIPGVGRVKALALLQSFSSIWEICSASPEQLERVVGRAAATHIHDFFHTDSAAGS
ncbi:Fanconi anemia core complex-associated protein 24-like isoform X2 [Salarias fasciatus]|uniref:Fanconi anemia core complex-associated protein 24-like isoform X2 n=1 Tax=Salarias fasciatus TaxID=181472 RepID=UPI001177018D|nr:Fanconi anemia core complex-associated protein 24-like isoform X2 [Salarias fasciatus]XP_029952006.1 Fanconi anemia core complex-associated protein 24-like isoform X2 [Salarias fasciatus]